MKIHITKEGETLSEIADLYGTSEEILKNSNELGDYSPTSGEELLILQPTRTYKVQYGDTPERIGLRFNLKRGDLLLNNPWIYGRSLKPGETIALKTSERKHGMSVANGYFYKDCSEDRLKKLLPYLTYVTFASAVADERGIKRTIDDTQLVSMVKENKKIPLVRVYDRFKERYKSSENHSDYAADLIELAVSGGYKGIVLDACHARDSAEVFSAFLIELRKLMIGCDLILITEINEDSPSDFSEYADGSVIYYPKYSMKNPLSFNDGERKLLADFACAGESAKTFIDLPSLASLSGGYSSITEALNRARRGRCEITNDKSTLLSYFRDKKQGEVSFCSMQNIKEIFDLIKEYDYMGICFDIMRVPMYQLLMYNCLFKTSYMNGVRTREGCSRGVEE